MVIVRLSLLEQDIVEYYYQHICVSAFDNKEKNLSKNLFEEIALKQRYSYINSPALFHKEMTFFFTDSSHSDWILKIHATHSIGHSPLQY